jgi:Mce-associated membrane protein
MDVPDTDASAASADGSSSADGSTSAASHEAPTLAGRALRALRPPRVAEPEPDVVAEDGSEPVTLTKAAPAPVESVPAPVENVPAPVREPDATIEPARSRVGGAWLVIVAAVLAVLALGYAAAGLAVHLAGRGDSSASVATARDDVVTAARIDIATLYTLDYRDPQAGLARWRAVSTGGFEQQIAQSGSTVATAISKAKLRTSGRVVAAAVTDLDAAKGTATVIASMDVTKTPASGKSATSRNRFRANMQRVNGVWKVADLSQVEVQLS